MYATVLPTHLVATVGLRLQPFLNCRAAVADVTADPIPGRSIASVPPAIQGSIGTPSISDNSGRVISRSIDFLPMIIFLSHPDASVVRRSKLAMNLSFSGHWTAPIWPRRTDRWLVHAELWITGAAANPLPKVSNRCWRSLSGKILVQGGGLRVPVGVRASSFPPRSPRLQSHRSSAKSPVRIGAAMRLAEPRSATAD